MTPNWTQVLRFAPGSVLHFTPALAASLRAALTQADARVAMWLALLDGATLSVTALEPQRCTVQAGAGESRVHFAATGHQVTVQIEHNQQQHTRELHDLALMLAGSREALIARRTDTGTTPYLRLRYSHSTPRPEAEVALYTAAFTQRLPAAARVLLPALLVVGRLQEKSGSEHDF